ncbi:hypothetical protein I4F81_012803 [Pyropia yezoensis]|uniref:Uncharacterized protein n=1 Tax=Pyropia yezoensis TaxID=2788 RepID=A0ACC3CK10_PYRYE|nr:hypothetical protein I4F81_012803 [Neopyropia yezoensis]
MEERGGCGPTRAAAGPLSTAGLGCTGHGATNRAAGGVGTLLSRPAHHQLATGRARRRRLRRRSVAAAPAASRTRPSPPPCSRVLRLTPRRNGGTSAGEGLGGSVRTVRVVARPLPCTDRPGGPGDPPAVPGLCTDRRPAPLPRPPPFLDNPPPPSRDRQRRGHSCAPARPQAAAAWNRPRPAAATTAAAAVVAGAAVATTAAATAAAETVAPGAATDRLAGGSATQYGSPPRCPPGALPPPGDKATLACRWVYADDGGETAVRRGQKR